MLKMGKVFSSLTRSFKNYNIESRAETAIGQTKRKAAPWYPGIAERVEKLKQEHSDVGEDLKRKNPALDEHLKQVYVTSHDPSVAPVQPRDPAKPLPTDREQHDDPEFGYYEPTPGRHIPGRLTLKQALQMLTDYHMDKARWSETALAKEYKLDVGVTQNILKYFGTFEYVVKGETVVKPKRLPPWMISSGNKDKDPRVLAATWMDPNYKEDEGVAKKKEGPTVAKIE